MYMLTTELVEGVLNLTKKAPGKYGQNAPQGREIKNIRFGENRDFRSRHGCVS